MYTGMIMLFGSSSGTSPCIPGYKEIKVPKKNMMGAVTRIQNLVFPMRLILEYRITIVPPRNNKKVVAVKVPERVTDPSLVK